MENNFVKSLNKKVAIYIRVSTHWQIDKDSLQVQRRELEAYASLVLGIEDSVVFEDPGYSAKNTDRPAYQQMMSRLRTGEFSHLLVWKIDRISRNLLDFAAMYEEIKRLGIVFVSKNEQFDTSTAIGEAMLKIILVFAELERNMTSERVTSVMLSRANNGQWNGGRIPYGYTYDTRTKLFAVDEAESAIVKKIYNMYEEYQSILYIARSLNEIGLKTHKGNDWTTAAIHRILTNPFYIGKYVYNVYCDGRATAKKDENEWITIDDHHDPIIDAKLFDRVQFLLKRNKRGGNQKGETHIRTNVHVFAGLLSCGKCHSNMSATLDRRRANGWQPSLYACSKRRHNKECDNKYVSDVTLGPFVFNFIANILRAKNNTTVSTPLSTLERKLLRGNMFEGVAHIDNDSLQSTKALFLADVSGVEYRPNNIFDTPDTSVDEIGILEERRRRTETALNRLKALYLYSDSVMPEKDFIMQRKELMDDLEETNKRLSELKSDSDDGSLSDNDFIAKASYFVMAEKLLENRYFDYENYIRYIDANIPKSFLKTIIEKITVLNGTVTEIKFKNGIKYTFSYKK